MLYVFLFLFYCDMFYFLWYYQGIFLCVDGLMGKEEFGLFCFGGLCDIYVLLVVVVGWFYVMDCWGQMFVVSYDDLKFLGLNVFDDVFNVLVVIVGDMIYLCGEEYFYVLSESFQSVRFERLGLCCFFFVC